MHNVHNRSWGLAILENGTSSRRAQEHSTTASPPCNIRSLTASDIPFGETTMPPDPAPTVSSQPRQFLPRTAAQKVIATGTSILISFF
ncbi:hypothetical protein CPB85DRAFT_1280397, partial [Mucidula mucida]